MSYHSSLLNTQKDRGLHPPLTKMLFPPPSLTNLQTLYHTVKRSNLLSSPVNGRQTQLHMQAIERFFITATIFERRSKNIYSRHDSQADEAEMVVVIDGKPMINIEDLAWEAQSRKEILEAIVAEAGGLEKGENFREDDEV